MFVLHCTKKLLTRLPAHARNLEGGDAASDTRLGDWTAHLFFVGRQQIVLGVNHTTLLPVLLPIAPSKTFVARFGDAVGEILIASGIEDRGGVAAEVHAMRECMTAPTNDRRVLGTINDFGRMLDSYVDGRSMMNAALHLAQAPCSPIGMSSPIDVARKAFGTPPRARAPQ